mgnify:CR=1 FL=1
MAALLHFAELAPGATGIEHGPWPDDCAACGRPGRYNGGKVLVDGVKALLTISEGAASVRCAAGREEIGYDSLEYELVGEIPVTTQLHWLCGDPGGWHGDNRCDCSWTVELTPERSP